MNNSRQAMILHRRNNDARTEIYPEGDLLLPQIANESVPADSYFDYEEGVVYRMNENAVHWQFPKLIVGYQPMRPINANAQGLMLQPAMVYQAENVVYQLRNEDFAKPAKPESNNDEKSKVNPTTQTNKPSSGESSKSDKQTSKTNADCEKDDDKAVKTVASQTTITLHSPDSLSVKKSLNSTDTAKVEQSRDAPSTEQCLKKTD